MDHTKRDDDAAGESGGKGSDLDKPQQPEEDFAVDEHKGKPLRGPEGGDRKHD